MLMNQKNESSSCSSSSRRRRTSISSSSSSRFVQRITRASNALRVPLRREQLSL